MKQFILSLVFSLYSLSVCYAADNFEALKADTGYFTDASCSRLKPDVDSKDLDGFKSVLLKNVATEMLGATYDKTYRATDYEAYPSPSALDKAMKLGDVFSRYENISGIYLEAGRFFSI